MKWNNRNLVPPGNYKSNPKKPEFDYNKALKPYGEGNRGKVWIPVQQIIMNVPENAVPVSPTPTPSITPTLTPTPTDGRACRTYSLATNFSTAGFSWTNCDGSFSSTTVPLFTTINVCAKLNSVSLTSGFGTITNLGTCPLPTPTPTPTPSTTPNAVCPQSLNITSSTDNIIDVGTYTRQTIASGITFDYGYLDTTSDASLVGSFILGTAPDGNNYPIFSYFDGGDYNTLFRKFIGSTDRGWWGVEQATNPLVSGLSGGGGQRNIGFNYTEISGIRFIKAGTNNGAIPGYNANVYVVYPASCPTPTPTPTSTTTPTTTPTPTNTTTPTPTLTRTPTPSPNPSGTTEANAYLSAVVAAGGTGITSTVSAATTTLFTSLVSNNLYNKIEVMYPMLGGISGSTSIEGKGRTAFNITWFNAGLPTDGITFNSSGATRNGTNVGGVNVGYGSTNFDCNVDATIMTNTSVSLGFYNGSQANNSNGFMGTIENFAENRLFILTNYSNVDWWSAGNDTSSSFTLGTLNNRGMLIQNRNNNTSSNLYQNGSVITTKTSAASSGLPAGVITLLGISQSNDTLWGSGPGRCQFAFIGQGLTAGEVSTLSSIINTFQTSLGRNTY